MNAYEFSCDPEGIKWAWWRPVIEGVATLEEIENAWSVDDLIDAHEALDMKAEIEIEAMKK